MTFAKRYEAHRESQVLDADPMELIRMLYAGALETVENARSCLRQGDIMGRSSAISKGVEILNELSSAVNLENGGDLARNLVELYDYMQRRLLEANTRQSEPELAEVAELLRTLGEAWRSCQSAAAVEPEPKFQPEAEPELEPEPVGAEPSYAGVLSGMRAPINDVTSRYRYQY